VPQAHLTHEEARQVLRYWLAALRHEAASSVGLPETPVEHDGVRFDPDLLQPTTGRPYFEVPVMDHETSGILDFLIQRRHHMQIDHLQARHAPFCEHALRDAYRREYLASRGQHSPEQGGMVVIGFPVVQFQQRGRRQLAPLFQLPVSVDWHDRDGRPWRPPSYQDRRRGAAGELPRSISLHAFDVALLGQPYLVNTNLLQRVTGCDAEAIDQLGTWIDEADEMSCETLISGMTTFLRDGDFDHEALYDAHPGVLIDELCHALANSFRSRGTTTVAPFAIVGDAAWGVPTAGLQREAGEIDKKPELWSPALLAYIAGESAASEELPLRGLFQARGLTATQRTAAERALGSVHTAVEGPPGTGKTDLVLNLVADTLVRNVAQGVYGRDERRPTNCVLVSTNNQAVDNVITPLAQGDSPPLALRLGNREVMALHATSTLDRVREFIEGADPRRARAELLEAQSVFDQLYEADEEGSGAELFCAARCVRDAWLRSRTAQLTPLLLRLRGAAGGRGWWSQQIGDESVRESLAAIFPAWGTTLLSISSTLPLERDVIDLLVIDEAGQCNVSYPVGALSRCRRALLLGDTHQLEPVTTLSDREELAILGDLTVPEHHPAWSTVRLTRSAHGSAQRLAEWRSHEVIRLRDHFRCQPKIIQLSNDLCEYALNVHTPPATSAAAEALDREVWVEGVKGQQEAWYGSQRNEAEAAFVATLVRELMDKGVAAEAIGVLTPYRAQTTLLRRLLRDAGVRVGDWEHSASTQGPEPRPDPGPLLGTIHRLQGGERDVVILSTVATEPNSITWLNERPNLMNVAVSRARDRLVIVGDVDALATGPYTRILVNQD
jgi:hypothetical protein